MIAPHALPPNGIHDREFKRSALEKFMQLFKKMLFVFITLINIFLGFGISWR
jgi:hypothetical protein